MADFTASQSITVQGLCQTLTTTDTSDYLNNREGYRESDIDYKIFTFRDGSGNIIKQEQVSGNVYSSSCAISLLSLNVNVELIVRFGIPLNSTYTVQNGRLLACLGV